MRKGRVGRCKSLEVYVGALERVCVSFQSLVSCCLGRKHEARATLLLLRLEKEPLRSDEARKAGEVPWATVLSKKLEDAGRRHRAISGGEKSTKGCL